MEVATTDPELGLVFYKLDARDASAPLRFDRDSDCLTCHGRSMTKLAGVDGAVVYGPARQPIPRRIGPRGRTPLEQRWGGWYVTRPAWGTSAPWQPDCPRRGPARKIVVDRELGANQGSLENYFDPSPYVRPDSDLVALLVLEHQVTVHNRLCEAALRVRKWCHYQRELQREMGEPIASEPVGTALRVVEGETERIVEALLFANEAPLPDGGVQGAGAFEPAFRKNARPDSEGRSLKDFDLKTRLFRFRCSYLVYSEALQSAAPLGDRVFRRLNEILVQRCPQSHSASAGRGAARFAKS